MSERPQFSLKAILVIIAILSVPLGMMVSEDGRNILLGMIIALPILFGCIGYLLGKWAGVMIGVLISLVAIWLVAPLVH